MRCARRSTVATGCWRPASSLIRRSLPRSRRSAQRSSCIVPGCRRSSKSSGWSCGCRRLRLARRPPMPARRYPPHIESAQHSFYYCPAIALLDGACGEAQFTAAKLASAQLRDLLAKVDLHEDAELTALWPRVQAVRSSCTCATAAVRSHRCPYPPGSPRFALTEQVSLRPSSMNMPTRCLDASGALELRTAVSESRELRGFARIRPPACGAPAT